MKKIVAVALIAVLAGLTLTLSERLPAAKANETTLGLAAWPIQCNYSMCYHQGTPFSYYDSWTTIGISAYYNQSTPDPPDNASVGYIDADWIHESASGGYYTQYGPF